MYLDPCDIRSRKNATCENDGNCIIKKTSNSANASCECAKGFHGEHCEIRNDKIESNLKANFIYTWIPLVDTILSNCRSF